MILLDISLAATMCLDFNVLLLDSEESLRR
jgi:hypothetical protein